MRITCYTTHAAAFRPATALRGGRMAVIRPLSTNTNTKLELVTSSDRYRVVMHAKAKKGGKGGKGGNSDDEPPPKKGGKVGKDSGSPMDADAAEAECKADAEERMMKCVEAVQSNFNTIRTGRANPSILDRIFVDSYGAPTPLKSLASITVPEASTLLVTPFDAKGSLKDIEKAIAMSDIGINPSNDGEKIRLNIPPLTQDRRKELVKAASTFGEEGKVAVRNVRKEMKKKTDKIELGKDAKKSLEDDIQKITDKHIKMIDDMVKTKSDELLKL